MSAPNPSTPEATKHTPGPWAISSWLDSRKRGEKEPCTLPWFIVPADHIDRNPGFSVYPEQDLAKYAQPFCSLSSGYRHRTDEEIWANARLIAAAPDVLAALRKIRDNNCECECQHDTYDCCNVVDEFCTYCIAAKAIAKAERGQ